MKIPLFCTTPNWHISGVNVFLANIIRANVFEGRDARLLLTGGGPRAGAAGCMPFPNDLPVESLGIRWYDSKLTGWNRLRRFLVRNAPCIFMPGYDWYHSYMAATLPPSVRVVSVLHSDEPVYYEWADRVGGCFDRIVTVSDAIADQLVAQRPDLQSRVSTIPYGIQAPEQPIVRLRQPSDPLRMVYVGRVLQYQKRVFDLPYIVEALDAMQVPVCLTVVGDGADNDLWKQVARPWIERGLIRCEPTKSNDRIGELLSDSDVFLLCSEFEGLPLALLEAMAAGCVPVVSDIRSGIPQVITDGENGFRAPIGAIQQFAQRIASLFREPELLARMSQRAAATIVQKQLRVEDMYRRYNELFNRLDVYREENIVRTMAGEIQLPHSLRIRGADYFPGQLRRAGRVGAKLINQMAKAA